jgi:hypothetical protein
MVTALRQTGLKYEEYKIKILFEFILLCYIEYTADGGTVVKVLRYKSEGHWFDSRWCLWNFSLT